VRHPRAHEIEHGALHAQFVVKGANRADRTVVNVRDEARRPVEQVIARVVGTVEKARRKGRRLGFGVQVRDSGLLGNHL
jgi:hypothetical protein